MKFQYLETIESFALVGASGLVGEEFLVAALLQELNKVGGAIRQLNCVPRISW